MKSYPFIIAALAASLSFGSCSAQQPDNLAVPQFEQGVARDKVQILDVRTQGEYNSGHLRNAFLADWTQRSQFEERVKHLDKNRPVYTYCLGGGRSAAAAAWLREAGFKEVYNLGGGITAWKGAGKALEGVSQEPPITPEMYAASLPKQGLVLVDFGAVWCPPCKKMEPVIEELQASHGKKFSFLKIDGAAQDALARHLKADAFPTFILYRDGKEVWRRQGIVSREEFLQQLQ